MLMKVQAKSKDNLNLKTSTSKGPQLTIWHKNKQQLGSSKPERPALYLT